MKKEFEIVIISIIAIIAIILLCTVSTHNLLKSSVAVSNLPPEPQNPFSETSQDDSGNSIGMAAFNTWSELSKYSYGNALVDTFSVTDPVSFINLSEEDFATLYVSASDDAVYRYGYYSLNNKNWKRFSFTKDNTNNLGGNWLKNDVSSSIRFSISDVLLSGQSRDDFDLFIDNFVIIYTCSKINNAWDCHGKKWQVKPFDILLNNGNTAASNTGSKAYKESLFVDSNTLDCQSDDNYDPFIRGMIRGFNVLNDANLQSEERCIDSMTLNESYCSDYGVIYEITHCVNGCYEGKCWSTNSYCKRFNNNEGVYTDKYSSGLSNTCIDGNYTVYTCNNELSAKTVTGCFECSNNTCLSRYAPYCNDTDGGKNLFTQAYTIAPDKYYANVYNQDLCFNTTHVIEGYCENNVYKTEIMACGVGCVSGACINVTEATPFCLDSDTSLYVKGFTKTAENINGIWDECIDDKVLNEYLCYYAPIPSSPGRVSKVGVLKSINYSCPDGCFNGACVYKKENQYCIDSDSGNNIYKKGFVNHTIWFVRDPCLTNNNCLSEDRCTGVNSMYEMSCNPQVNGGFLVYGTAATGLDCPTGYICKNDECISDGTANYSGYCLDSDNGENYFIGGRTNYNYSVSGLYSNGEMMYYNGTATVYDACEKGILTEYYCGIEKNTSYLGKTIYVCPYGCDADDINEGYCAETDGSSCYDSDNGKNLVVNGVVTYTNVYNQTEKGYDVCQNSTVLNEQYCEYGVYYKGKAFAYAVVKQYPCVNGCNAGACLPQNCTTAEDCGFESSSSKSASYGSFTT